MACCQAAANSRRHVDAYGPPFLARSLSLSLECTCEGRRRLGLLQSGSTLRLRYCALWDGHNMTGDADAPGTVVTIVAKRHRQVSRVHPARRDFGGGGAAPQTPLL
jgi:hypothetical protein